MINFLKGIIVGIGGIAPGLSGSVLLVIFGLYQKTIKAIGTLFKDLKKNLMFLVCFHLVYLPLNYCFYFLLFFAHKMSSN